MIGYLFLSLYLLLQIWIGVRNKEFRERKLALLPLPVFKIALARILIIAITACFLCSFYFILQQLPHLEVAIDFEPLLAGVGFFMLLFSAYFIIRDLFLYRIRAGGVTKLRMKLFLILLIFVLNLLMI